MSLSNTETFAFTTIPSGIHKCWRRKCMSNSASIENRPSLNHRFSAIAQIDLSIKFEGQDEWYKSTCSAADDQDETAITAWRELRTIWTDLENAIDETISSYVKTVRKASIESKNYTYDAPVSTSTEIARALDQVPLESPCARTQDQSPRRTYDPTVLSIRTGLRPDDSASIAPMTTEEFRNAIKAEVRHRMKKKNSKKSDSTGKSLLSYAAGRH
jgi:hypothetical protein